MKSQKLRRALEALELVAALALAIPIIYVSTGHVYYIEAIAKHFCGH